MDRPHLHADSRRADVHKAVNEIDIDGHIDEIDVFVKSRRRQSIKCPSKHELLQAAILTDLDKAFPQRMALPAGARRSA